jgi:hypothetical protein
MAMTASRRQSARDEEGVAAQIDAIEPMAGQRQQTGRPERRNQIERA